MRLHLLRGGAVFFNTKKDMKKIYTTLLSLLVPVMMSAQGWPANYGGVMLQAFYWNSYDDTNWLVLTSQADELASAFDLIWIPQSGDCGGLSMGYDDCYWFPGHYNSSFGSEQQLKTMIQTFKSKGLKTIADVVINHRKSTNGWFGFPTESYRGTTYSMGPADVCKNDDGGKAKTEADRLGVTLGANDTGEGWDGMRDLDHTSENVQTTCKAYTKMLIDYFGYAGFRYDMVKGYKGEYTKLYNEYAQPEFSVGECWDGTTTIKNWINDTGKTSAAFDFQFKYVVRNATDKKDWTWLGKQNDNVNWPVINDADYRQYSVTFVENHDTEVRPDGSSNGPLRRDTLAANAYMLAMPGTPCVFLKHWLEYKNDIKSMIDVRKLAGITNTSTFSNMRSNARYYANLIKNGSAGVLQVVVGSDLATYVPNGYTKVLTGYHYAYYLPNTMEIAWADKSSGTYTEPFDVMLSAVSAQSGAQLVYTTNGSNPTASSTKAASGTKVRISANGTTTLKVGLLVGSTVSKVITRTYTIKEPEVFTIPDFCHIYAGETAAFFEAPLTWTSDVYAWAWGGSGSPNYTGGTWPGEKCTKIGTRDGKSVWKWKYTGSLTTKPSMIIFSNSGTPQTDDLTFTNGGYYTKEGLQGTVSTTGISPTLALPQGEGVYYDLSGRRVEHPTKGLYIVNGKKILVK